MAGLLRERCVSGPSWPARPGSWTAPRRASGRWAAGRSRCRSPGSRASARRGTCRARPGRPVRRACGSVRMSGSPSSPLNRVVSRNGKSTSAGSRMWKTITSWRRWRKCFRPGEDPRPTSSKRSERTTTTPRFLNRSARSWKIVAEVGLLAGRGDVHHVEQLLQVRRLARRLEVAADLVVEGRQADRVLLLEDHVGERRGDELGVLELRDVRARGVRHRLAGVEQQVGEEVRLLLVLLEVELVGLATRPSSRRGGCRRRGRTRGARRTRRRSRGRGSCACPAT